MKTRYSKHSSRLLGLFFSLLLSFSFGKVQATHIVGGEINYRCLGNNMYEISMRIFRDCDTGNPWFDNPASIGVFDVNNNLVFDLRLYMRENDTLDLHLSDPCLVVPPNVCIHTTSYLDTVHLPYLAGGYQLVYQRCCRNVDIVNILTPLSTGATYYCLITEEALLNCNNSAVFNAWPPVYICAGIPISFDHSAFDTDGDSLVYELCTPLDGATFGNPMPQPPFNPPYNLVTWIPPYSMNNMLGGPDSLRIHPQTGLLQGTPNILGVFVVGICVKEYRNGVLISTSRRDFQYAVGICGELVSSAFFAPEIQCDNSLAVQFQNNSQSLGTGYSWYFGDTTTNAGSTLENPIYIYPDTGVYAVTLIADPGSLCTDTATLLINLQYESIFMDFNVSVIDCSDSLLLQVTDLTIDTISTITQWHWDFGNGQTSNVPFASAVYNQSGTYIISLQVQAANGCELEMTDTISLNLPSISSADTVAICPGQSNIILNPGGDPTHQYQWSPTLGLSSTTAPSPLANPTSTTTYSVTVTAFNGVDSCVLYRTITVVLPPPIGLQPIPDTTTCGNSITLFANTTGAANIDWSFSPIFAPIFSTQNPVTIIMPPPPSSTNLYVRAKDAYGCSERDTVKIIGQNIPINTDFSYTIPGCGQQLFVQFADQSNDTSQGPIVSWDWTFGNGTSSNQQNPVAVYNSGGPFIVTLQVTSSRGCSGIHQDTISNWLLPQLFGSDTVGICPGQTSVVLNAGGNPAFSYQWSPGTGLSSTTDPSPTASPAVPTIYTVTITAVNGQDTCVNVDTVFVGFPPPISVTVPDYTYCGNCLTLTATSSTAISYDWAGNPSFFTILATGNPITLCPTTFPFSGYYVRATDAYGCTASDFSLVQQITTPLNVNYSWESLQCDDTLQVQFTNLTVIPSGTTINTLLWTVSNGQTSTQQNPVFTFTRGQSYTVTLNITLSNGCSGNFTQNLDFNIASLMTNGTVALCSGATSVALNPGGDSTGMSYQWSPSTGLNSTTSHNPMATPPSIPFVYTVTVTAYNSFDTCIAVHNVTVINPPPISVSLVEDTTFCSTQYFVYATPSGPINYLDWALNPAFNPSILPNANPVVISFGSFPSTYVLYVRVRDQYGCEARDTGIYRYITTPVPVVATATPQGCDDDSLVVQYNGAATPSFGTVTSWNWDFGNGLSSNQQNPLITYTASPSTQTYSLTVTTSNGCTGTYNDILQYQVPAFFSNDSIGLCGETGSFLLNQGGNPDLLYQWSPPTGLNSTTDPSPIFTPTGTNMTYTVTITAPNAGDTCTAIHTMYVIADSFEFEAMPDTLLCERSIELSVNSPTANWIEWALDRNFQLILGYGNPYFTNINSSRWFYVRGRNALGCYAEDSVYVQVRTSPIHVDFVMNPLICEDSLLIQFQDLTTDTLNNPLSSWHWSFGTGDTSQLQNPLYNYPQAGSYTITLSVETANGCNGERSQPLIFNLPNIAIDGDTMVICSGAVVELNPNGDATLNYSWSPSIGLDDPFSPNPLANPSVQTTYTVTVSAINQLGSFTDTCTLIRNVTVAVPPIVTVQASDDSLTCDSDITLYSVSNFGTQYQWASDPDFNNILSNTSDLNIIQNNNLQTYYVQTTDAYGCTAIDSVLVEQRALSLGLDSAAVACPNEPASLTVSNLNSLDILTYLWSPDSLLISGQGSNTIQTAPDSATLYTVVVNNQYGCVDTLQAWVHVSSSFPLLEIVANPDTIFIGQVAQLIATENPTYTYVWTQNPSLSATHIFNPNAFPIVATRYYLEVTEPGGCKNRDSVTVYTKSFVCEEPYIFVPNTFTPNGDGLNDIFYVRGNVITELYFVIYNRWGEKIFETNDQNTGWDGTFGGSQLPPDAYGYYLRYKCIGMGASDEYQFKKGNVTLIR